MYAHVDATQAFAGGVNAANGGGIREEGERNKEWGILGRRRG